MKTTKEKADELVEQFLPYISGADRYNQAELYHKSIAVSVSILSVKHTIEVLEKIQDKNANDDIDNYHITMEIFEQTELLTELESRL